MLLPCCMFFVSVCVCVCGVCIWLDGTRPAFLIFGEEHPPVHSLARLHTSKNLIKCETDNFAKSLLLCEAECCCSVAGAGRRFRVEILYSSRSQMGAQTSKCAHPCVSFRQSGLSSYKNYFVRAPAQWNNFVRFYYLLFYAGGGAIKASKSTGIIRS